MKFLVDELPTKNDKCPAQLRCDDAAFPPVCLFKVSEHHLREGIVFDFNQYINCNVCVNKPCPFLKKA